MLLLTPYMVAYLWVRTISFKHSSDVYFGVHIPCWRFSFVTISDRGTAYLFEQEISRDCFIFLSQYIFNTTTIYFKKSQHQRVGMMILFGSGTIQNSFVSFLDTSDNWQHLCKIYTCYFLVQKLMETAENMAYYLMGTVSALIVNAIIAPVFIAEILPVLVLYYYVQKYFITTSR